MKLTEYNSLPLWTETSEHERKFGQKYILVVELNANFEGVYIVTLRLDYDYFDIPEYGPYIRPPDIPFSVKLEAIERN